MKWTGRTEQLGEGAEASMLIDMEIDIVIDVELMGLKTSI
jgi:hypothetical protein